MSKNTENQTKFTTLINSIGYSGYNVTAIKRGLEYFLRNKDKKNFMLCLEELYLFSQFCKDEKEEKIANGILSSIKNKLIILFDEELSFIEIDKYLLVRKILQLFESNKNFKYLSVVSDILFDCQLSKRNISGKVFFTYSDTPNEDLSDENLFKQFKIYFEKDDDECLKYMYKILDNNNLGKKRIFNRRENIYMIWEYLSNLELDENIKKVFDYKLNNFYNRRNKSRHLFLSSVVDMCMNKNDYENKLDKLENKYEIKQDVKVKKKKRDTLDLESINFNKESKNDEEENKYFNSEWNDFYWNFSTPKEKRTSKKSKKKETIDKDSDEEINLDKISDDSLSDEESDKGECKVKVL
jgi:hypothetical protein